MSATAHRLLFPVLLAVVAAAGTGAVHAAGAIEPAGPVGVLAGADPCPQLAPDVAPLDGGGFIAVWVDLAGNFGIGARRLDPTGAPIGDELTLWLAPATATVLGQLQVAPGADGGFVVGWSYVDLQPFQWNILLQAFDGDGTPRGVPVLAGTETPSLITHVALATDGQGRPALVWASQPYVSLRLFEADLTPRTDRLDVALAGNDPTRVAGLPAIAADAAGDVLVTWEEAPTVNGPFLFERIRGRQFDESGTPRGDEFVIHQSPAGGRERSLSPAAAARAGGGWIVAWAGLTVGSGQVVEARLLDASGAPLGDVFRVDDVPQRETYDPDLVALGDGSFAVVWWTWLHPPPINPLPPGLDQQRVVLIRRFDRTGEPLAEHPTSLGPNDLARWQGQPAVAAAADSFRPVAVWRHHDPPPATCNRFSEILVQRLRAGCVENGDRLCLQNGRFGIEVVVTDPRLDPPIPRLAGAERLTADSGTFWFFRPANVELIAKLLDGSAVNGSFWFFSGAMTNVGHEIVVTDYETGTGRRYVNPPGELASRADTGSFPDSP